VFRTVLLPVLWLAGASAAAQNPGAFTLRGQIVGPPVQVSGNLEVVLERSVDHSVAKTYTDSSGNFEFRNIEAGRYDVVVKADGYETARQYVEVGNSLADSVGLAAAEAADPTALANAPPGVIGPIFVVLRRKSAIPGVESDAETEAAPAVIAELTQKYSRKLADEYAKALEFNRKGETGKALERMEFVVKQAADLPVVRNSLGVLYQKAGRRRDAEREYNAARKLNPQLTAALLNLGSLYLEEAEDSAALGPIATGRILDDALDVLEAAVKLQPDSALAHYLLGVANYQSSFDEEAEAGFKRAFELERMPPARLMLAHIYARQTKWTDALTQLDAYLKENPNSPDRAQVLEMRSKVVEDLQAGKK